MKLLVILFIDITVIATIRCIIFGENKCPSCHPLLPDIEEYVKENVDTLILNNVIGDSGSERKYMLSDSLFPGNLQ